MTTKNNNGRKTFDIRLYIQIAVMLLVGSSMWYGSQIRAAVTNSRLNFHIEQESIHGDYEELSSQFMPRTELKTEFTNIDKYLRSIEEDIKWIRENMVIK